MVRVLLVPHPAMTGTCPLDSSTAILMTRRHSSLLNVGVSPVVPQGADRELHSRVVFYTTRERIHNQLQNLDPPLERSDQSGENTI